MGAQPRGRRPRRPSPTAASAATSLARPASAAEAEEIFALAAAFYPGYGHYRTRVGDSRRIRVFVVEPVSGG